MAYGASIQQLLSELKKRCPRAVPDLELVRGRVVNGLLSVGLKLHILEENQGFAKLITALGGSFRVLERNVYKRADAISCLVLPPVGSAEAAIRLLHCLETYTECKIFDNPKVQIQVCSPGRLDARRSALLGVLFYLGSRMIRRYDFETSFLTTVSTEYYNRGRRLVIYDAGPTGDFNREFPWWEWDYWQRKVRERSELPFEPSRTDILVGAGSPHDIQNINLVASLLMHTQYKHFNGCWWKLGQEFQKEAEGMLGDHFLSGILDAPWVHQAQGPEALGDGKFFSALNELMNYALEEGVRVQKESAGLSSSRKPNTMPEGILSETDTLLQVYRRSVEDKPHPEGEPR